MRTTSQRGARHPLPLPLPPPATQCARPGPERPPEDEEGKREIRQSISVRTTEEETADCDPAKSAGRGGRRRDQSDALEMSRPVVPTSA